MTATAVAEAILEADLVVAQAQLARRGVRLERKGHIVEFWFPGLLPGTVIVFDGHDYDAAPLSLFVADTNGDPVDATRWPPGLNHSTHPITRRPFACLQGLAEYFLHPSHSSDSWDRYRNQIRLVHLVEHILCKAPAE